MRFHVARNFRAENPRDAQLSRNSATALAFAARSRGAWSSSSASVRPGRRLRGLFAAAAMAGPLLVSGSHWASVHREPALASKNAARPVREADLRAAPDAAAPDAVHRADVDFTATATTPKTRTPPPATMSRTGSSRPSAPTR